MIVVEMAQNSTGIDLERVRKSVERGGTSCRIVSGREASYIVASDGTDTSGVSALPGVRKVNAVSCCYPLASRAVRPGSRPVEIAPGVVLGEGDPVIMAGPCAVESRDQLLETALAVRKAGARILRGGAFKPRSHPYAFQGLGSEGIALLKEARKASGLPVITEVMSPEEAEWVAPHVDILQVGARNMQNFSLLKVLGRLDRPVLLKRGMAATVEEWLQAAEYILAGGNDRVILCERGIRSFDRNTRNTLDLGVIPLLKSLTHLPVVADPSHATGRRDLVLPMSLAAIAAGADGLLVEVHCDPGAALCDGPQSLDPEEFSRLMTAAKRIMEAVREEGTPWQRMLAR
ncbi:MAG TPA: 3-deoxy-7-phosphoheptulonate synthase [Aminivibrio sp.]|jgi:3-deoxy-7-phosphoheptulonate synthase|uniref:3-deoxy-7-phosphoheptulonate synthase n=1 Tax=Aminivibrio sp. TaxID=1872489 RepID=UPI002C0B5B4A|nr:3-deoxy-7-phosphoheptulonate synthase [Aminivibrio sp.]NCB16858.1 3-deoxy-7-phosphoheptulonate synthase [Synergistales bacterium]HPF84991.1 3-deoxy-7-phosphoheptulonate synthase [Aminivibrio sp.]